MHILMSAGLSFLRTTVSLLP